MLKVKTKRQPRELVMMFAAIGSAVFMYVTRFYRPDNKTVLESVAKITARKQEVSANETLIADLKVKVGDITQKIEQSQNEKPTRFLSELINEINARDTGVRVNSYTSRETPVESSIYAVNLDLELESSFLDLATMIERLEEKYRFLEFKKVDTKKATDFLQKCISNVSLSIYLDKERI